MQYVVFAVDHFENIVVKGDIAHLGAISHLVTIPVESRPLVRGYRVRELTVIVDCDKPGHKAYLKGTPGFTKVVEGFGPEVVGEDGGINRKVLGSNVFGNKAEHEKLNQIVWPEVAKLAQDQSAEYAKEGHDVVVLDAAVLLEASWDEMQELSDQVLMEGSLRQSIGKKKISVKPRGLKPYERNLRLKGETRFLNIPKNEKAKISGCTIINDTLPQRKQNAIPSSSVVPTSVLSNVASSVPPSVPQLASSSNTNQYLNEVEAYFHELKCQKGIFIAGQYSNVVAAQEYDARKGRLQPDKYVVIQRQGRSFHDEECHWTYWCSCDTNVSRQMSSLHKNINMGYSDFCELYHDCLHIKTARMMFDQYDVTNEIEPFDETLQDQDNDHRYTVIEELYEVPGANLILCRSLKSGHFGLLNHKLECVSCKKDYHCDHSQLCKQIKNSGSENQWYDLIQKLEPESTEKRTDKAVHKRTVLSFLKIPFEVNDLLTARLKDLQGGYGDTLLPELTECYSCGGELKEGDPISEGWLAYERAIVVTNTYVKHVQVYYRPCLSCEAVTIFEGNTKCLLNMGTYLVGYDVLRSYMHSFLHGRRPLYTFYQTWCDVHIDYGNKSIQDEFPYSKLLRSWHAFLGLLDIDFSSGFACPDCGGDDGQPETVICDGTSLSFQRRMWQWNDENPSGQIKDLTMSKFCDRVFIQDAGTRMLLKRYSVTGKAIRRSKLKPLDSNELRKLKTQVSAISKPLYNIIIEIEGDPALFSVYQKFLFTLASPSPVSALLRPVKTVENLVNVIVSETNIKEEPVLWADLHRSMPIIFEIFEKHEVTDNMKLLISELWNISMLTFVSSFEDIGDQSVDLSIAHPDDELSFFPNLPKSRQRGQYSMDRAKSKQKECCSKKYAGHPSLLPGVFTMFCQHGVCYGFQVMQSNESPNVPFSILRTRFKKAPKHVIYDNACKLHAYCLHRDPLFFKNTEFYVDRLHWDNHSSCSYGYELSRYPQFEHLNSQCNEQANSGLKRIKDQLSYMTASNFMMHCTFYLRNMNMKKLNKLKCADYVNSSKLPTNKLSQTV